MDGQFQDFQTTMAGLESGLRVEAISVFDLLTCVPTDRLSDVWSHMRDAGLDQFPVREDGHIVGVLDGASELPDGLVRDAMCLLRENMLVAASDPVGILLPLLRDASYRLVVRAGRISGIVTRSDLIKLPVRLHAFAQVTHLEMLMARLVQLHLPEQDQWIRYLSELRREKVEGKIREHAEARLDPNPLEFTDFCDKRTILKKHLHLGGSFEKDLGKVEDLRNTIAHAGDYGGSIEELQEFIDQVELAKCWIDEIGRRIEERLAESDQNVEADNSAASS
jgi:CBS domain-containing protein